MPIGNIVLVMGQSNAMNAGTGGQPVPGGYTADSNVQIWTGSGLATYNPGVNSNGDLASTTWGPEMEYSRLRRIARPGETLYIVKHATSGVGVAQKSGGPSEFSPYSTAEHWDATFAACTGACNALYNAGKMPVLDTALIAFGEADAVLQADADAFKYNLQMVLTAIRARMPAHQMRAVLNRPFPSSTPPAYLATTRAAIETIGGYYRNAWIDTDDLPHTSDGHIQPAGVVTQGARMWAADQAILP